MVFSKKNWAIVFCDSWTHFSIVTSILFKRVFASSSISFLTGGRHSTEEHINFRNKVSKRLEWNLDNSNTILVYKKNFFETLDGLIFKNWFIKLTV